MEQIIEKARIGALVYIISEETGEIVIENLDVNTDRIGALAALAEKCGFNSLREANEAWGGCGHLTVCFGDVEVESEESCSDLTW